MKKLLVIGSLNMDFVTNVPHPLAVGETMLAQDLRLVPGGKGANQAYAMGRLGGCAAMLGAVGADLHGQRLKQNLSKVGVDVSALKESQEQPTGMAVITVLPHGDNSILVLPGANSQVTPAYVQQHLDLLEACDYVVFQLEIPLETVVYAAKEASRLGKKAILDPAPAVPGLPAGGRPFPAGPWSEKRVGHLGRGGFLPAARGWNRGPHPRGQHGKGGGYHGSRG